MKKKETYWFIEAQDAHTNEVVVKNFSPLGQVSDIMHLIDNEGVSRAVFQAEKYEVIARLYRDQKKFNLLFGIFYREGKYGKLKPWKFGGQG